MKKKAIKTCSKQIKTGSKRIKTRSNGLRTRSETGAKSNSKMELSEGELKKRLITKRKIVKQKLDFLKHGEIVKEKMFSPITRHLKEIKNKLHNNNNNTSQIKKIDEVATKDPFIKKSENSFLFEDEPLRIHQPSEHEEVTPKLSRYMAEQLSTSVNQISLNQDANEDPSADKLSILEEINNDNENSLLTSPEGDHRSKFADLAEKSYKDYLEQYDPLPRKYIAGMYSDDVNEEYDHKYGVRLDTLTEKFMIGNSRLDIDGSDIIIKKKRYRGTLGLYELLFKKNPTNFTKEDAENYKQIVLKTNAHRRYYKVNNQIDGSKLTKYKKIIAPMVTGRGILMEVDGNKIDYVHWDDPNELVDRLRLLLASVSAGHTNHINEVNSIIEELREARIIV